MPVSAEEYRKLLERERARYHAVGEGGGDKRDQAVRSANIAAGFGNSTAERFMEKKAAAASAQPKGAGSTAAPTETPAVPVPKARPDIADLFVEPGIGSGYPTPTREPGIGSGYPIPPPDFPQYFGQQPAPPDFPQYFGQQPAPPGFPQYWGEQPQPPFPVVWGQPQPPPAPPPTDFRPYEGVQPPIAASPINLRSMFK